MNSSHGDPAYEAPRAAITSGDASDAASRPRIRDFGRKSPGWAAILSTMPGLGQVYVGFYRRGFTYMGMVALWITALNAGLGALEPLFGFSLAFFWIYNMIDASRMARIYNRAGELGQEIDLSEAANLPDIGGSLVGGIVLILGGLLLLLHLKFDVSMRWLEEWWPILPIALGVYLVVKSIRARQSDMAP